MSASMSAEKGLVQLLSLFIFLAIPKFWEWFIEYKAIKEEAWKVVWLRETICRDGDVDIDHEDGDLWLKWWGSENRSNQWRGNVHVSRSISQIQTDTRIHRHKYVHYNSKDRLYVSCSYVLYSQSWNSEYTWSVDPLNTNALLSA